MPTTTRRVCFPEPMEVVLEEVELLALGTKDIRVRTDSTLISTGTELSSLVNKPWTTPNGQTVPNYPSYTGYSNAGTVVEVGSEVSTCKEGDRVASGASHIGLATVNTNQAYWQVPEDVAFEDATFTILSATVLNATRLGKPQLGDVAAVIGLGIIGQMTSQFVRLCGAEKVIGIDMDSFRLERGLAAGGITHTVNPGETDPVEAVRDLSEGRGADVVYEATGLTPTFNLAFDLAKIKGNVVALGSPRWPAEVDMMQLHMKALNLIGAIVSSHPNPGSDDNRWDRQANGEFFFRLLAENKVNMQELISHRFASENAKDAFMLLVEKPEPILAVQLKWG